MSIKSILFTFLLLLSMLSTACSDPDTTVSHVPLFSPAALIVTSDFRQSGSYSVANAQNADLYNDVELIHQDSSCRITNGIPFLVSHLGADSVLSLAPENNWQILNEFSLGPGTNPKDIAVLNDEKAYAALFNESYIKVIHPGTGNFINSIDLSDMADADGVPEISWLLIHNNILYALLQRLDMNQSYAPTDYSLLVSIDTATDTPLLSIPLSGTNPFAKFRFNQFINRFVIVEAGIFSSMYDDAALDDGIDLFNPSTGQLSGFITTAQQLGGDIVDAVLLSMTKGYAIVGNVGDTDLVLFNPQTGEKEATLIDGNSWNLSTLELTPDGSQLWVADRNESSPGVRIFNTVSDTEVSNSPIVTTLPPVMVCFWENVQNSSGN